MPTYIFVNQLQAQPGRRGELIDLLREFGESIHTEPGGVHYSVHVPVDDGDGPVTTIQAYSSIEAFHEHSAWMEPNVPRLLDVLAEPPRPPVLLEQVPLSGHARESFSAISVVGPRARDYLHHAD